MEWPGSRGWDGWLISGNGGADDGLWLYGHGCVAKILASAAEWSGLVSWMDHSWQLAHEAGSCCQSPVNQPLQIKSVGPTKREETNSRETRNSE